MEDKDISQEISDLKSEIDDLHTENSTLESQITDLRESAITGIDDDELLWNRLSDVLGQVDIPGYKLRELQQRSWAAFNTTPIAYRRISFVTSLVTGKSLQFLSGYSDIKEVVDQFWKNPINQMSTKIKEYVNLVQIDGEIFFRFFIDTNTGEVTLRTIPSSEIVENDSIITDPDDDEIPLYYKRQYARNVYVDGRYSTQNLTEYIPSIYLMT